MVWYAPPLAAMPEGPRAPSARQMDAESPQQQPLPLRKPRYYNTRKGSHTCDVNEETLWVNTCKVTVDLSLYVCGLDVLF